MWVSMISMSCLMWGTFAFTNTKKWRHRSADRICPIREEKHVPIRKNGLDAKWIVPLPKNRPYLFRNSGFGNGLFSVFSGIVSLADIF